MKLVFHHRIATRHGQAVHMDELIAALEGLGHEVIVVGPPRTGGSAFGGGGGVVRRLKERVPRALYEIAELGYSIPATARLWRAVRRHRPDAVYERYAIYLLAGVWVRRMTRTPLLLEVNSPMFEERRDFGGGIALERLAEWAQRSVWKGADVVLPVTEVLAERLRDAGVRSERITVVHNGIDPTRFPVLDGGPVRERLGLTDKVVLGFTGFVREWHGVDRVVALLPRLAERADVHLLVVGDGPARQELEEQASDLGVRDRLTVTGVVGRDDIAAHVATFDVALQIGVTAYASPLKLFEYMAMGRAVVAPSTPNIQEVVRDDRDALLFTPDDDEALAAVIERASGDAELRARLGVAARRTIDERGYTWKANAQRVADLVDGVRLR
jgi:glycosyltransferase involved in cell wall biosynthesis